MKLITSFSLRWPGRRSNGKNLPNRSGSPPRADLANSNTVKLNVHDMKLFPFELRALVSLVVAALVPFIPVVLMMMPIRSIVTELARLLV